jgi:hypothetical protein
MFSVENTYSLRSPVEGWDVSPEARPLGRALHPTWRTLAACRVDAHCRHLFVGQAFSPAVTLSRDRQAAISLNNGNAGAFL